MGMTYNELSIYGRMRKVDKLGPYGMWSKLLHVSSIIPFQYNLFLHYQSQEMSQVQNHIISFWVWKLTQNVGVGRRIEPQRYIQEGPLVLVSPLSYAHCFTCSTEISP